MGKLIYAINASLDGFICDQDGIFDWAEPNEEAHSFINDIEGKCELLLLGRRMYEILAWWDAVDGIEKYPDYIQAFEGIWKRTKKMVFSKSLKEVGARNTILKNEFLPDEIAALKKETKGDIGIGGADLASQALEGGLVDEIMLFTYPVIVGRGRRWIANDRLRRTSLLGTKTFEGGIVFSHYSVL
jgi:dihydrofolate reductase